MILINRIPPTCCFAATYSGMLDVHSRDEDRAEAFLSILHQTPAKPNQDRSPLPFYHSHSLIPQSVVTNNALYIVYRRWIGYFQPSFELEALLTRAHTTCIRTKMSWVALFGGWSLLTMTGSCSIDCCLDHGPESNQGHKNTEDEGSDDLGRDCHCQGGR